MSFKFIVPLLTVFLIISINLAIGQELTPDNFEIKLKSRNYTPIEGISLESVVTGSEGGRVHVLIQFKTIPNQSVKRALSNAGIMLLNYIPNNAWFASVPTDLIPDIPALSTVRWIGRILPEDKISPSIKEKGIGERGRTEDGKVKLVIKYFKDVSGEELKNKLLKDGITVLGETPLANSITISISEEKISNLAREDSIRWIGPVPPPTRGESYRIRSHVQSGDAQSLLGLSGNGVTVGMFENSHAYIDHPDLSGRASIGDPADPDNWTWHATMVAGVIGGDGTDTYNYRGMAPSVDIYTYDYSIGATTSGEHQDFLNDIQSAINIDQIDIANNSWGSQGCDDFAYGQYEGLCPSLDSAVRGDYGRPITVVFSAGNERYGCGEEWDDDNNRPQDQHCISENDAPYSNYKTLNHPKSAKNIIAVGAIDSYNNKMSTYSSWGPTEDGRIKPEIVASGHHNGVDMSGVTQALVGTSMYWAAYYPPDDFMYGWFGLTSCAAAAASGCIALLLEDYRTQFPASDDPLPSTVKALLIHTAQDLDDDTSWYNKGPDYASGYGLLQIKDAIDLMRTGSFREDRVDQNDWMYYSFSVPQGAEAVKVTLVWDDPPAAENAASADVNDLDLVVRDPEGVRHFPWTLDKNNPSAPAARTHKDYRNNVEQVYVDNNVMAGTWGILVKGDVQEGPQKFSIVALDVTPSQPLCVNPGGTGVCYDSIQTAIDAALWGEVVHVYDGTYNENNIDFGMKEITLQSVNGAEHTIIDSASLGSGGVLEFLGYQSRKMVVDGFTITGDGVGVVCTEASPTIKNCTISENSSIGISIFRSSPMINNCLISDNRHCGIVCYQSPATISNCIISGNTASILPGNAISLGGGIYIYDASPSITNCIFADNIADSGGGISTTYHSSPTIANSLFYGNQALSSNSGSGGGGLFIDFYSEPMLINCTFGENSATNDGGGIFASGGLGFTTTLINSILWSNIAGRFGPQIALQNSVTVSVSYSDVQGGQAPVYVESGCTLDWSTGNIDDDPLFIDAANGDFYLTIGSPCIDTGNSSVSGLPDFDLRGYPRITDGDYNGVASVDIGVYEYQEDFDADGIADSIDTQPTQYSDDFADAAGTNGTIIDRGDQLLAIEPDPEGIRIIASEDGGPSPATISTCNGSSTETLTAGDEEIVHCSHVYIKVISGTVDITYFTADGSTATTSLNAGNSLECDTTTLTFSAPSTNPEVVVVVIDGHEYQIYPGEVAILLDGDGDVDYTDFDLLLDTFDKCDGDPGYDERADLTGDGCVDCADYQEFISLFPEAGTAVLSAVEYCWGDPAPGYSVAGWPIFESWLSVRVENTGTIDAENVVATILVAPENCEIIDGDATVGNVATGSSAWSNDTFRIKVDTSNPQGPDEGIFWKIEYDANGEHIVEVVPEFPGAVFCAD